SQHRAVNFEVTKVNKGELVFIDNPRYQNMIEQNPHLKGVIMEDIDQKERLPVHIILGASDYAMLKTDQPPRVGKSGQPVAELTQFGWTIMSPGKESCDVTNMLLTQTFQADYEELCRLDVLGLKDTPTNDQHSVFDEFKEQLTRDPAGCIEQEEVKEKATTIFEDAGFMLHKWHSNERELETTQSQDGNPTYAKQQLGTPEGGDSSLLGLVWNKEQDTVAVTMPTEKTVFTKRGVLAKLAKIYDPLGFVSPLTLT
ncbi:Hypothetical predicted protein, partial [Paramuricea clavata]